MKKILLVEDQVIVRQGIKMMIEQEKSLQVVAEAGDGMEAISKMELHAIDCVVMDIRMPVMNGIEAARIMKQRWPHVKILMLTTFNDDEYALQSLKDGVNGFLLKTAEREELIKAILSCIDGGMPLNQEVTAKVMPRLLLQKKKEAADIPLTPRELAIARCVGNEMTNKEIADELHLSIGTVKNHITAILQKLELRDRTQLAIFAVKNDLSE
ncbi:response regulator transcription factor [Cytobacillus dafuensis]|uniref:Response regulator transcription factor n=1 Tax=Cytobacillus dafuensis TaxID=1742359 RepID=A0A5B8YZX8_CYTDA|nr:response regulator transcription factor [Cytobacillus dafuensis]QED46235.1 response regulator transcription factor [Cytobacillus dafuensis]